MDGRTDRQTDTQTDRQTDRVITIYPQTLFAGDIINELVILINYLVILLNTPIFVNFGLPYKSAEKYSTGTG